MSEGARQKRARGPEGEGAAGSSDDGAANGNGGGEGSGGDVPISVKFRPGDDVAAPAPAPQVEMVRRIGMVSPDGDTKAVDEALQTYWKDVLQKHGRTDTSEQLKIEGEPKQLLKSGKRVGWHITLEGCSTGRLDELAFETLLPKEKLLEWLEMLVGQKQMVFSGAPGCGKTYLARRLAMWLLRRDQERYDLVQFSSGYACAREAVPHFPLHSPLAYSGSAPNGADEDFVQGLRAKADEAAINSTIMKTAEMIGSLADGSLAKDAEVTLPTGAVRRADPDGKCELKLDSEQGKAILTGGATAAAQVIGTSKTFQAAAGPLVALSRKSVAAAGAEATDEPVTDMDKLLTILKAGRPSSEKLTAGHLKVLVIDEMNRAKVSDVFGARTTHPHDSFCLSSHSLAQERLAGEC